MKNRGAIVFFFLIFFASGLQGQSSTDWFPFWDSAKELYGYKDSAGKVMIKPKSCPYITPEPRFRNIMAVLEFKKSYYLLKNGKKVGKGKVYTFDFTFDYESEGKILFKDDKKDRVGFLDSNGKEIIPAVYNYATSFRGGYSLASRNAVRHCHGSPCQERKCCEHWGWKGGELILINEKNEVLVENIQVDLSNVNWYDVKINDATVDTNSYIRLQGKDGNVYAFLDYEKEFKYWFHTKFIPSLQPDSAVVFKTFLLDEICMNTKGNNSISSDSFMNTEFKSFNKELFTDTTGRILNIWEWSYFNTFSNLKGKYQNAFEEIDRFRYPIFMVCISDSKGMCDHKEFYLFIRTELGYKMLLVEY